MARIPLRPQPAGHEFVDAKTFPDWAAVFGSTGPLELEIGCGAGGFALNHAQKHSNIRLVAFEWRKKFAREVAFRAEKNGVTNLRVVEADARTEIPRLFEPGSLSVVHVQFPDPWWKRAHHKRAVVQPEFSKFLFTLIKAGGHFDMRTDVKDRAQQMLAILEGAGFVNPLGAGTFHPYDPDEVPSTRERRYLASGEPVYRARLLRP